MKNSILFAALLVTACASDGDDADTRVQGSAVHRDASDRAPARPAPQAIALEVRVAGTGTLSGLASPECTLDAASGAFTGLFSGAGSISDDGAFVATSSRTSAAFTTPTTACEIPEVSMEVLTEVVLVASIEATTANCEA